VNSTFSLCVFVFCLQSPCEYVYVVLRDRGRGGRGGEGMREINLNVKFFCLFLFSNRQVRPLEEWEGVGKEANASVALRSITAHVSDTFVT